MQTCGVLGSALGPMPFGIVRDLFGSFALAFLGAFFLQVVFALAALMCGAAPRSRAGDAGLSPSPRRTAPSRFGRGRKRRQYDRVSDDEDGPLRSHRPAAGLEMVAVQPEGEAPEEPRL